LHCILLQMNTRFTKYSCSETADSILPGSEVVDLTVSLLQQLPAIQGHPGFVRPSRFCCALRASPGRGGPSVQHPSEGSYCSIRSLSVSATENFLSGQLAPIKLLQSCCSHWFCSVLKTEEESC